MNVLVLEAETMEGSVQLSKLQADRLLAWDKMEEAKQENQPLEVVVTAVVKGGLSVGRIRYQGLYSGIAGGSLLC